MNIGNLQINKLCLGDVEVTKAYLGDVEVYSSGPNPEGQYMTMTVLDGEAGTVISPTVKGSLPNLNLQYRLNGGDWNDFIVGTTADIHVVAGDFVQWKGVNESGISNSTANYLNFSISGNPVSLSGNVMSLIDGVGDALEIPCNYCFYKMFSTSNVKTVSLYFLPATTLKNYCYQRMFYGCTSLVNAPELNATNLADYCYERMFYGCTSLTTAPELPATTIKTECYASMFRGCTSLVQSPSLPATTLANYCYYELFSGCTSLVQAPALPATILANSCYNSMFSGCTSLVQAPALPATKLENNCYAYMFSGCSNLNYIKSLATNITATGSLNSWLNRVATTGTFVKPAGVTYQTGVSGIPSGWTVEEIVEPTQEKYLTMTVDESAGETTIAPTVTGSLPNLNLQYRINNGDWTDFIVGTTSDIKVVAGDVVQWKGNNPDGVSTSYNDYLNFVVSDNVHLSGNIMSLIDGVGDALKIPNKLCFYYLFYNNSAIKTVSSDFLPATTLKEECYRCLFNYCSNLTQAPSLPATTLATYCYEEMFSGCSSLKQAPELPATTLVDCCYNYMFMYCSSLNYLKCSATDNISTSTISGWLSGVSSNGTFVKPAGVSYETGDSGIPSGWTIEEI